MPLSPAIEFIIDLTMNTFISMLRGINVSGQKKIRMAELKSLYASLGQVKVQIYVQSGNVVFATPEPDATKLAGLIETQIEQTFGFAVTVFIRDNHDFQRIIDRNRFWHDRHEDPARLHVTFLYRRPDESNLDALAVPTGQADEFFAGAPEIFLFCLNGYGRTKLSPDRSLSLPAIVMRSGLSPES